MGNSQVSKSLNPSPKVPKCKQPVETMLELIVAIQKAFSHGFDEGPHWSQINLYDDES